MSEYQHYEFQAVDRPLKRKEREELRAISTRARITASGFADRYKWGDLKADPETLLACYFDLILYVTNWGSRRFAMRLPKGTVETTDLDRFALDEDFATIRQTGDNLIIDIHIDELEFDDWDDGAGWLAALSQLRADVLGGDLRVFYLIWLMAVEAGCVRSDTPEPLPGIAPATAALRTFAAFFAIDGDLFDAATQAAPGHAGSPPPDAVAAFIGTQPEAEKTALLVCLHDGDPHVGAALRRRCRQASGLPVARRRTAGALRDAAIRGQHDRKRTFIERLDRAGLGAEAP